MAWGHFGPNIRESVKVGNTIDIECYTKWNGTNSQRGGGIVYALIDEDNNFLLDANGNAQWREITLVSANGEPNDWRHQQLNGFVIPTLYKADGSGIPVDKATIHIYPAVGHGFQPTLFDDLKVTISRSNEQESYFMAVIEESHDYHEFGMEMASRGFHGDYRFR